MSALTRRALLQAVAALAVLPHLTGCQVAPGDLLPTKVALSDILLAWFGEGDRDGIDALGAAYLALVDGDDAADLDALLAPVADLSSVDDVVASLQATLAKDFDAARVVTPEGWVLGRTEARLCALSWIVGPDDSAPVMQTPSKA